MMSAMRVLVAKTCKCDCVPHQKRDVQRSIKWEMLLQLFHLYFSRPVMKMIYQVRQCHWICPDESQKGASSSMLDASQAMKSNASCLGDLEQGQAPSSWSSGPAIWPGDSSDYV